MISVEIDFYFLELPQFKKNMPKLQVFQRKSGELFQ